MSTVNIRYIVDDVTRAIDFYTNLPGFSVKMHPAPGFAALKKNTSKQRIDKYIKAALNLLPKEWRAKHKD